MKTYTSIFYFFIANVLIFGFLVACQSTEKTTINEDNCLPPLFEFSFPYKEPANGNEISPAASVAGIVAQTDKKNQPIDLFEGNLVVRSDDEIWLLEPLTRYTPSTRETKEYNVWDNEGNIVYPRSLFLSSDNTLYAEVNNSTNNGIAFALYDEKNDNFEIVSPATKMLLGGHVVPGGYDIFEDKGGNFWFVYKDTLFFMDHNMQKVEKMLGEEQGYFLFNALTRASEHSFFVITKTTREGEDGKVEPQIILYNTETGNIQFVGIPPLDGSFFNLHFDDKKRLWVSDFGYFKHDNASEIWEWYEVVKSPIFITDQMEGMPYQYFWVRADPSLTTHNRFLWFTFSGGLARLDITENKWCLVARMPVFDVAKDSQNNIWFVSDKQLYKYEFRP